MSHPTELLNHPPALSSVRRVHAVTFYAPGALDDEAEMRRMPDGWSIEEAVRIGRDLVLRYGDRPHSFDFTTTLVSDRIPDGEGGWLDVQPRIVAVSGRHFLGGRVRTLDDVVADNLDEDGVLRLNMVKNHRWIMVDTMRKFRSMRELKPEDLVLDLDGRVVDRGDDPRHVAYRACRDAEVRSARVAPAGGGEVPL